MLERLGGERLLERAPRALAHTYTLLVTLAGWVLFRSLELPSAGRYLAGMLPGTPAAQGASLPFASLWWAGLALFACAHVAMARRVFSGPIERLPDWAFATGYGLALALIAPWIATDFQPFIYFQF